jgi:hypothetical protein
MIFGSWSCASTRGNTGSSAKADARESSIMLVVAALIDPACTLNRLRAIVNRDF